MYRHLVNEINHTVAAHWLCTQ